MKLLNQPGRLALILVAVLMAVAARAVCEDGVVLLQSGQDIQEAINQAVDGAEIRLAPGIYTGGLTITKPLLIKGNGHYPNEVRIVGKETGGPVIRVHSQTEISVQLENLSLLEASGQCPADDAIVCTPGPNGLEVEGAVAASISNVRIAANEACGIVVVGPASLSIADSVIENNGSDGVRSPGGKIMMGLCSIFSNGGSGIHVWGNVDFAQLTVSETSITGNQKGGIFLFGATSTLEGCTITDNETGIGIFAKSRVTITGSRVCWNRDTGIQVHTSACSFPGYSEAYQFEGEIWGSANCVAWNGEDLCPSWALSSLVDAVACEGEQAARSAMETPSEAPVSPVGDNATAVLMNDLEESARALVLVFSESVEITGFVGPFLAQSPLGQSTQFQFSTGQALPGEGFSITWSPARASILTHEWLVDTPASEHAPEPSLAGKVLFNGLPISTLVATEPTSWYRDETTDGFYEDAVMEYDPETGSYRIYGLPDHAMSVSFEFDVNGDDAYTAGDFRVYHHEVDIGKLSPEERNNYDLPAWVVIHLREPVDNGYILEHGFDPLAVFESPMQLEWEPVPGATSYEVSIAINRSAEHPAGFGRIAQVIRQTIDYTTLSAYLLDSREHEEYWLTLYAFNEQGEQIGQLMLSYSALAFSLGYAFQIGP